MVEKLRNVLKLREDRNLLGYDPGQSKSTNNNIFMSDFNEYARLRVLNFWYDGQHFEFIGLLNALGEREQLIYTRKTKGSTEEKSRTNGTRIVERRFKIGLWRSDCLYCEYIEGRKNSFEFERIASFPDFAHEISVQRMCGEHQTLLGTRNWNAFFSEHFQHEIKELLIEALWDRGVRRWEFELQCEISRRMGKWVPQRAFLKWVNNLLRLGVIVNIDGYLYIRQTFRDYRASHPNIPIRNLITTFGYYKRGMASLIGNENRDLVLEVLEEGTQTTEEIVLAISELQSKGDERALRLLKRYDNIRDKAQMKNAMSAVRKLLQQYELRCEIEGKGHKKVARWGKAKARETALQMNSYLNKIYKYRSNVSLTQRRDDFIVACLTLRDVSSFMVLRDMIAVYPFESIETKHLLWNSLFTWRQQDLLLERILKDMVRRGVIEVDGDVKKFYYLKVENLPREPFSV